MNPQIGLLFSPFLPFHRKRVVKQWKVSKQNNGRVCVGNFTFTHWLFARTSKMLRSQQFNGVFLIRAAVVIYRCAESRISCPNIQLPEPGSLWSCSGAVSVKTSDNQVHCTTISAAEAHNRWDMLVMQTNKWHHSFSLVTAFCIRLTLTFRKLMNLNIKAYQNS